MLFSVLSIGASAEYRCPDDIHAWNHGTVQKYPATCTSRAYSVYECMYCSVTLRQEYGPVAPHTDKDQTIKVSVYGGEEKDVTFAEGETKTIIFER